ncbi:hypothetical protein QSV34_10770 [Porticoccus sp. W117]|uniref:hypothetical protein n=1 Tax=Porticoccus sp. W117 TaxID=3054777 RepID=UPI002593DF16|nr:hypothetical protein [Porticoccus sp. W117]MDM3871832.1 hypothetical protein [Porticoccus sp. W117]
MTITKDQLELLERPLQKNEELRYTIGGPVEAAVHSNLENERTGKLNQGHKAMNGAAHSLEQNMAFKAREGFAKAQFQQKAGEIPPQDLPIAESTWRQNHIEAHRGTLNKASNRLRSDIQQASHNQAPPIDTDLGYGASASRPYVDAYIKQHGPKARLIRNEQVRVFAETMKQDPQSRDLER